MENKEWSDLYENKGIGETENVLRLIHLKAYDFAEPLCKGKKVLEIGCGSGYGTKILSAVAREVTAADVDIEAIHYAEKHYPSENITFQRINNNGILPFPSDSFEVVVLFQVIEHIPPEEARKFLLEIKRVLHYDGILLLTTPNRKFRLLPFQKPNNPHHYLEYTPKLLGKLLSSVFMKVEIWGMKGIPEIEIIERKRVKQSPCQVYIRGPIYGLIKLVLPEWAIDSIRKVYKKFFYQFSDSSDQAEKSSPARYSLKDLSYSEDSLNKSIDLMGVCKK